MPSCCFRNSMRLNPLISEIFCRNRGPVVAAGWEERECGNAIISNTTASHLLRRYRAAVGRRGHIFPQGLSRAWHRWKRIFCIHAEYVCGWDLHGVHEIINEQCFWRRADVLSRGNSMGDCQAPRRKTGILDWVALLVALALGTLVVTYGVEAANSSTGAKDGIPAGMYFFLGSVALLSAAGTFVCFGTAVFLARSVLRDICGGCALRCLSPLPPCFWHGHNCSRRYCARRG
jgi:hypothetical protein